MTLGNNIRYLRKKHNFSQEKLATLLGYKSFTTIQKWESGVAEPPFKTLARLAAIFNVDIDDLAKKDLSVSSPLYSAAAGPGRIDDGYPDTEYPFRLEADEFIYEVHGDSMEPTLQDGDKVIVVAQSILDNPSQIALVKINGEEATLKHVQIDDAGLTLIADNVSVYPPKRFTAKDVTELPIRIMGVVRTIIRDI